jgi:2,4-dienoyl-CoA reductase-like NADH-dependent reductase (Old Yellow Enzyme family)
VNGERTSYAALFKPGQLAKLQVKNRFVCSATYEAMATEAGEVTDDIVKRYRNLARGDVGLIISGLIYVHPLGRATKQQLGIHDDRMIPGLKRVLESVHQEGGKMVFQLVHAGRQTTKAVIGQTPIGPSDNGRDPTYFVKPKKMTEEQIREVIQAFGKAASRAIEAGADGIQIHAAHGYLANQFLSPFFNRRTDDWGSSDENRFRFLREIILETRRVLPEGMPILVKLSTHDHTPQEGVTPPLATRYAKRLAELGIDGLELSCGSTYYSIFNMSRGEVPVREIVGGLPWWEKPLGRIVMGRKVGKYDLQEGYNLEAAQMVKPVVGKVPVFLVGGLRRVSHMEEILEKGYADFVSMSRPFIREPFLVRRIKEGKTSVASCVSCNKCMAAVVNGMPLRCYSKGLPSESS